MTGFGRGVAEQAGLRATVDIRAVNHRFLDLKLRGAALAPAVEEAVNAKIRAAIERGSVTVSINVARSAPGGPGQVTKRLQERIARLREGQDIALDPARLAQEVAVLADRADITEELVRLASHLDQARALAIGPGAVGRRLDFLVQEIGRE